jgi:hypothetical protein
MCTFIFTHVYLYTHECTHKHTYTHAHTHAHTRTHMYAPHTRTHAAKSFSCCIKTYQQKSIYTYTYIHTYTHINTHTNISTQSHTHTHTHNTHKLTHTHTHTHTRSGITRWLRCKLLCRNRVDVHHANPLSRYMCAKCPAIYMWKPVQRIETRGSVRRWQFSVR